MCTELQMDGSQCAGIACVGAVHARHLGGRTFRTDQLLPRLQQQRRAKMFVLAVSLVEPSRLYSFWRTALSVPSVRSFAVVVRTV